jgi:Lrp/AsnC family transcriptional regulator, leucine-responsive regulatory protein
LWRHDVIHSQVELRHFDYLLRVVARDLDDLGESVLKRLLRLPGVKDVRSTIVLDVVKNGPPVPLSPIE